MLKNKELLYERIERYLEGLINTGKLKAGDRLLSEREIARKFRTSNLPVRQAMQKFIDKGIMQKVQGRGTFIKKVDPRVRTDKIGVMYCHSQKGFFSSPFYSEILSGIEAAAQVEKKTLVLRSLVRDKTENPNLAFHDLLEDVDGFIMVDMLPTIYAQVKKTLPALSKPVVVLNDEHEWENLDSVVTDSPGNTRKLVQYLVDLGHRRIACVYGRDDEHGVSPNYFNRLAAYQDTLKANNLPVAEELVRPFVLEAEEGDGYLLRELMARPGPPTALICLGSYMASTYFYPHAKKLGIAIPRDLSVVVYDNTLDCQTLDPPITTIDTSLTHMGSLGVTRLLEREREMSRGLDSRQRLVLQGNLVVRGSQRSLI